MKISKFANLTGVTIKTLHYYDEIGLLTPSRKTDSGYRIYCDKDFLKLQQINTLKFIGLTLNEIKIFLDNKEYDIENLIHIQKKELEEKRKHIDSVIEALNNAENQIIENKVLDVENLIKIIKMTNIESKVKEQYETSENFDKREDLHSYNINKTDWNTWCFDNMSFTKKARILELGCGTGGLWLKNINKVNKNWNITLSDFSTGMLEKTREQLKCVGHNFNYKVIDAQNIPYNDESFDIVIARHMLYLVPDIEKVLSEVKRILVKGGVFYVTTNAPEAMSELNEIMDGFDCKSGLGSNGMCERFDSISGNILLKKYFANVKLNTLSGKIIVDKAKPIVDYKASTIKGRNILMGEKKQEFIKYIENYIDENGAVSITTKGCILKGVK
ncbi:MerR family transcriptional regulator [Clostridium senegalense]|uniref:Methyltransferase domain-containing protein n=1 Tax=Clostridium senegalense TaxID=1465809 RepID=A0A6M0H7T3_9CLOT|nr:methyltransferase domain-containing protein [Clostridium senegalense]NEU06597.1 methyltransferase domain-containing protein [Clostridium senegalense]